MSLQSGLYHSYKTVIEPYNVCQMGVSGDEAYMCPKPGSYGLKIYYNIPQISRDDDFHYTPDIKMNFYDGSSNNNANSSNSYLQRIGCATTGTVAFHKRADTKAAHGLIALGICVSVFVVVFGLLIYLSYQRKKQIETQNYYAHNNNNNNNGRSSSRSTFNYFRTLPSGQAIPLPNSRRQQQQGRGSGSGSGVGLTTTVRSSASTDDEASGGGDALNISNPSYTTHRPII